MIPTCQQTVTFPTVPRSTERFRDGSVERSEAPVRLVDSGLLSAPKRTTVWGRRGPWPEDLYPRWDWGGCQEGPVVPSEKVRLDP